MLFLASMVAFADRSTVIFHLSLFKGLINFRSFSTLCFHEFFGAFRYLQQQKNLVTMVDNHRNQNK